MSTIIRTRSPFFIRTPQETNSSLSYFEINITVKSGVLGVVGCPANLGTYSLQKKPLGTEGSVTIEISELVNDFIEQKFVNNTPAGYNVSADTQSVWATVTTSARESDGTIIGSATTTNYLAQEGYNNFKDGVNYITEPIAMISSPYIQYKKGDYIFLPVNAERVQKAVFKNNGSTISTYNVSDNDNANQKIEYASYLTTSQEIDEITIRYDVEYETSIKVEQIEECKYPVHKIVFLNRWGAFQDLYFFKKSSESLNTTSENFNRSIFEARKTTYGFPFGGGGCTAAYTYNVYNSNAHANKTFNSNGVESITLNSGYVNELMNPYFEELMVSEYVWLIGSNNVVYPVNLKESSFDKKTGLNNGLINYTMNFDKSFALVNNIR